MDNDSNLFCHYTPLQWIQNRTIKIKCLLENTECNACIVLYVAPKSPNIIYFEDILHSCLILCTIGAVFALIDHPSVCQETIRDLLLDLPLISSPIILLCMNKELRNQCVLLLQRNSSDHYMEKVRKTNEQLNILTAGETNIILH